MSQIKQLLSAVRIHGVVGREREMALFRTALQAKDLPFCLLFVHGQGGVGKTTLLRTFANLCAEEDCLCVTLDGRNIEPTPESFFAALLAGFHLPPDTDPITFLGEDTGRRVLLIDSYEMLAPLDGWLRESFLPECSTQTLVVLAGRQPPGTGWQQDEGWQQLSVAIDLQNLSDDESRTYLNRRHIPAAHHESVLRFTHGLPLALSLVADVYGQSGTFNHDFQPEANPNIVQSLLNRFLNDVLGTFYRAAIEISAIVLHTDEAILSEMLRQEEGGESADSHALFLWLQKLSFIETGAQGLFPHDVVREVLLADLRWRNFDRYLDLHKRARTYYNARLWHAADPQRQQHTVFDFLFLHRDNAVVRSAFTWQQNTTLMVDKLRAGDHSEIRAMVARHEGEESAQIADLWLASQPDGFLLFRDTRQNRIAGFMLLLALHETTAEERAQDPAASAAWEYLEEDVPLRAGEAATHFRFWMAEDTYHTVSPVQSLVVVYSVRHYLIKQNLAFSFFTVGRPEKWERQFAYGEMRRLQRADFTVGGRTYGIYGQDWRELPPAAWLARLAEKEVAIAPSLETLPPPPTELPLLVLSESEFAAAVRHALRTLNQTAQIAKNPLIRSRIIVTGAETAAPADRAVRLAALIRSTVETLNTAPRQARGYRALYHTYLQPAASQEEAARLLDLPFSTYRRHLNEGLNEIIALLWQQEIGASG